MSVNYIEKALTVSTEMLTVTEFIKATDFPIDMFMIDRFWHTMEEDKLIYVDDELIRWMGYNANSTLDRKKNFMKLLTNDNDSFFVKSTKEYSNYLASLSPERVSQYPPVPTTKGKVNAKHLLLTPKCLKSAVLKLNTKKGDRIREYFVSMEHLLKLYTTYQSIFNGKSLKDTLNEMAASPVNISYTKAQQDKEDTPDDNSGYVYFIKMQDGVEHLSYVKIGYSKDVETRLQDLQVGSPFELVLLRRIFSENASELEKEMHSKYAQYRTRGEWFRMPTSVVNGEIILA